MTSPEDPTAIAATPPGETLWRLCAVDTVTGKVVMNLPLPASPTFTNPFNGAGQLDVQINVSGGARPSDANLVLLKQKFRVALVLAYGNKVCQWACINDTQVDDTSTPALMKFTVDTMWDFLAKYRFVRNLGVDPTLPAADVAFGPTVADPLNQNLSQGGVARRLVEMALGGTGFPLYRLPIVLPDPGGFVGNTTITYAASDQKAVGEALGDIVVLDPPPEIAFTPAWANLDHTFVEINMRISPDGGRLGQMGFPHSWGYHGACVDFQPGSGTPPVNVVIEKGADNRSDGGTGALAMAVVQDMTLPGQGWPVIEQADSTHSDETVVTNLQGYGNAILKAANQRTATMTIRVDGCNANGVKVSPALDELEEGDTGVVTFDDDDPHPDLGTGDWAIRIMSLGAGQDLLTAQLTVQIVGEVQH